MRKELRLRLATEYRYAATKMQQSAPPVKKLFYFSVLFGEAQRILNWEWNRDLALIHMVTQSTYNQINIMAQNPILGATFPVGGSIIYDQLTQATSDLASYLEKTEDNDSKEELHQILGRFAEITYVAGGNGSYLYEKGLIKL